VTGGNPRTIARCPGAENIGGSMSSLEARMLRPRKAVAASRHELAFLVLGLILAGLVAILTATPNVVAAWASPI